MQIIAGKPILTTLDEILDPSRAALLVVDVQNDFCSPGGVWSEQGYDLGMMATVLPQVGRLTETAREAGVLVSYVQMLMPPRLETMAPAYLRFMVERCRLSPEHLGCAPGTWGAEIVAAVAPRPGDLVIPKWRSSAFVGTPLDLTLRSRGVESVVVCGVATHACVESTIRDAFNLDYYVVEVEDAVGAYDRHLHEASLTVMRGRIDVVSTSDVCRLWAQVAPRATGSGDRGAVAMPRAGGGGPD